MGEIHKIGDEYYIEFMARGLKYQQKAGADRAVAQKLLKEIEHKIAHGEMGTLVRDADVDIFMKDFLDHVRREHPPLTVKRFQAAVEHFYSYVSAKFPDIKKLSQIPPNIFEQYKNSLIREKKASAKVINFSLILLREFCEFARKTGYLNDNPLLHIKFVPAVYRVPRYVDEAELDLILSLAPPEFKNKSVSIPEELGIVLQRLKKDSKFKAGFMAKIVQVIADKDVTVRMLQNTFAWQAVKRNVSLVNLAKMMKADDILDVMIYFPYFYNGRDDVLLSAPHAFR